MDKRTKYILAIMNSTNKALKFLNQNGISKHLSTLDQINREIKHCLDNELFSEQASIKSYLVDDMHSIDEIIRRIKTSKAQTLLLQLEERTDAFFERLLRIFLSLPLSPENNKRNTEQENPSTHSDIIVIDTDDIEPPKEGNGLFESRKNVSNVIRSRNASLVSILITGYNRLEKTRRCVDSIIKHTTDIDFELILLDNGSSDGTLDFYKSVEHKNKKIIHITKNFGGGFANFVVTPNLRGKYFVGLSNDLVLTKNWLSNLIKCCESDKRIGMAVPMSTNVSNYQDPGFVFGSHDEMERQAESFNVSNPQKWHERLRLITLAPLMKCECLDMVGGFDYGFFHDFADDDMAFRIRRAGYKIILCKDVFIHHNHEIFKGENKNPETFQKSLESGRQIFRDKYYGIDAWNDVNNYEFTMIELAVPPIGNNGIKILGVDVKCGTPILELKNRLRDFNLYNVALSAFSEEAKYLIDLNTICDDEVVCDHIACIAEKFPSCTFDYIILGKPINLYAQPGKMLADILKLLNLNGQILFKLRNTCDIRTLLNTLGNKGHFDGECPLHISIENLQDIIVDRGGQLEEIRAEKFRADESILHQISDLVKHTQLTENFEDTFNRLFIENYVLRMTKKRNISI